MKTSKEMFPSVIRFLDGTVFLVLSAVLVAATIFGTFARSLLRQRIVTFTAVACIVGLLFTATPTPVALQWGLWIALLAFAISGMRRFHGRSFRFGSSCALAAVSAWMMVLELAQTHAHTIQIQGSQVYVVGDSLSAGIERDDVPWPSLLAKYAGLNCRSLAKAGASIEDGVSQLGSLPLTGATVLVLLGGNDMITGSSAEIYETSLRNLIGVIRSRGGVPVLIEFPLFPFKEAYGRAFRRIAKETNTTVIPKRILGNVLAQSGNTVDGLHLSSSGHEELARRVGRLIVFR